MRPRQRVTAAIGAFTCALILSGCGEAATVSLDPTAPATPNHASSEPSTTEPESGATGLSGLDGATPYAVAARPDGLIAAGVDQDGAAAWTSSDAAAWERVPVQDAQGVAQLRAVGFSADGGIAFGGGDDAASEVWTSEDGTDWQAAEASGIDGRVNAVSVGDDTWIAAGDRVDPEAGESYGGAVWSSDDGRAWETIGPDLPLNEGTLSDLAVAGETVVVAGFDLDGGKLWTSSGGEEFRAVAGEAFEAATIQGVAALDDGFVALGQTVGDLAPLAWTSPDGTTWTRTELDAAAFPPDDEIHDLATAGGSLVAVGASADGGVVWTSADGLSWSRAP